MIPAAIRDELRAHAAEEAPNECCGVIVLRHGVAERYVRGRNRLASPYRYELEVEPEVWFLEDDGYELAVFHSHPASEPRPSRTDRELAGLWAGKPFLIYGLARDELRAWRFDRETVAEIEVELGSPGGEPRASTSMGAPFRETPERGSPSGEPRS